MRMKKTMVPIYDYRFIMIESEDPAEMYQFFKKVDFEFDRREIYAHAVDATVFEKGEKYICVYLVLNTKNKFAPITHSVIAHESVHLADFIFEQIGSNNFNDEPHNYLVEYFVKEINLFLKIENKI